MINARSIRDKTTELVDFVCDNHLYVIGICETWLTPNNSAVIADLIPDGYTFKHVPRPNRRGGGVGLLYKNGVHVNIRNNPQNFIFFESLQAEIISNAAAIHLVIVYRPPSSLQQIPGGILQSC